MHPIRFGCSVVDDFQTVLFEQSPDNPLRRCSLNVCALFSSFSEVLVQRAQTADEIQGLTSNPTCRELPFTHYSTSSAVMDSKAPMPDLRKFANPLLTDDVFLNRKELAGEDHAFIPANERDQPFLSL